MDKPIQIILVLGNSNIDIMNKRLDTALLYYYKLFRIYNQSNREREPNNTPIFGQTNNNTPIFGQTNNNTPIFGQTNNNTPVFNFGQTNNNTPVFNFGQTNNNTPVFNFGQTNNTVNSVQPNNTNNSVQPNNTNNSVQPNNTNNNIYILVSGKGKGIETSFAKHMTESDYMYDYLVKKINKDNIIKENDSMTTYESIFNSFNMIKNIFNSKTQLSTSISDFGKPVKNYIYINICTSTFHLKRTMLISNYIILKNNLTNNNNNYHYYFQNENIFLNNFNVKYIHTNEIPTNEQTSKELNLIDNFLSQSINHDIIL